jgi:toxin HigB-1
VIRSFRDAEAEKLFRNEFSKKRQAIERPARKRLEALDAAESLNDLRAIPGNSLEAFKWDREGQHSIRINDQYRICFVWRDAGAEDVEIVDYH